jgi:hypothetical protein
MDDGDDKMSASKKKRLRKQKRDAAHATKA